MTVIQTNLPIDDDFAEGQRASFIATQRLFEPQFIVRPEAPPDLGADGSIELRQMLMDKPRATGMRAWFQLKHKSSPRRLTDGSISLSLDTKNINYLHNYPCAFYLMYDRTADTMLFRWWREVREELDRQHPDWNGQKEVSVRFRRVVDEKLLREIADEIQSHITRMRQMSDGPRFVRFAREEAAARLLAPDSLFVGRKKELRELRERFGRSRIVPVTGEPDAGKKELVRHSLCNPEVLDFLEHSLGGPLALLVVDPSSHLEPSLLRGIAWSLGLNKSWDVETDDIDQTRQRADLLAEDLPARVQGQRLVLVVQNAERCLDKLKERAHFDALLGSDPLRTGCAVVVSRWGSPPNGANTRFVQPEVRVGSLEPSLVRELFSAVDVAAPILSKAIYEASEWPELFLPGIIRRAAASFALRTSRGELATSDLLVNELIDSRANVVEQVLTGLGCDGPSKEDQPFGPLGVLIAMSILARQPSHKDELAAAGLSPGTIERLFDVGWFEQTAADDYRLTPAGYRSLRHEFGRLLRDPAKHDVVMSVVLQALTAQLHAISACLTEERSDEFSRSIEEGLAWVRDSGLAATQVEDVLVKTLLPYIVDDVFFPTQVAGLTADTDKFHVAKGPAMLDDAVAQVVLAVRAGAAAEDFLTLLRAAAKAAAIAPVLLPLYVRALDMSALLGQRRYHRHREILAIRQLLVTRLTTLTPQEAYDVGLLKWSSSWILNTALIAMQIGDSDSARAVVSAARAVVGRLPPPKSTHAASDESWMRARLAQVESRLARDTATRIEWLREAVSAAMSALENSPYHPRFINFAFRAIRRLAEDLPADDQRDQLLEQTTHRLASIYGHAAEWPLVIKAQAIALGRNTGALSAAPERRLHQAMLFLNRFEDIATEAETLARLGDGRALLVLARTNAFVARCNFDLGENELQSLFSEKAVSLAKHVIETAPSSSGWALYLSLLDEQEWQSDVGAWHTEGLGGSLITMGPKVHGSIKSAREWLKSLDCWNVTDGQLAMWCLKRMWQTEGSLEPWAIMQELKQGRLWADMPGTAKLRALAERHRERRAAINRIESRSGPFLNLYVLRMTTEAQFQRLIAIYGNHKVDVRPIQSYLDHAKRLWPDSHILLKEEGRFERYLWNYAAAIAAFRRVRTAAPVGSERREATMDLIEVILTAVVHCESVQFTDGTKVQRQTLVAEARDLLTEFLGFRHVSEQVCMLRDRADLEAGVEINWSVLESAFDAVVGDVDSYTDTLMAHLTELRIEHSTFPERIADRVLQNFTSADALRDLGWLFLRRVELDASAAPVLDCKKAYAAFQACRICERAWSTNGRESAITSYQRGRAILVAAKVAGSAMPFQAHLESKRDLLHLAESLFQRAKDLSVGMFHVEAKRRILEAAQLRRGFGN